MAGAGENSSKALQEEMKLQSDTGKLKSLQNYDFYNLHCG